MLVLPIYWQVLPPAAQNCDVCRISVMGKLNGGNLTVQTEVALQRKKKQIWVTYGQKKSGIGPDYPAV